MSRRLPRESRSIDRHVRLHHYLMDTAAWKSLPAAARAIYVGLARHYNSKNNGRIGYSVRQASKDTNVSPDTASRMLNLLQERGFTALMKKGAFNRKARHATEWRLTEYICDVTGQMPSKEFARWRPDGNLEHGTTSRTDRSFPSDHSVIPIGQNKTGHLSYGTTTRTVEPSTCPTRRTLIGNQG
jgi:hypothetical protein